jgi:hypothetical protein
MGLTLVAATALLADRGRVQIIHRHLPARYWRIRQRVEQTLASERLGVNGSWQPDRDAGAVIHDGGDRLGSCGLCTGIWDNRRSRALVYTCEDRARVDSESDGRMSRMDTPHGA